MAIRLAQAAKELNVGLQTIVESLKEENIIVDNKPTTKIEEDVFEILLKKFNKDKVAKTQADKLELGKNIKEASKIETKKPEPEKIVTKKIAIEGPKVLGKITEEPKPEAAKETEPIAVEPVEVETKEEIKEIETEKKVSKKQEIIKAQKIAIEGPTVLGKLDLSEKPKKVEIKKTESTETLIPEKTKPAKKKVQTEALKEETIVQVPREIVELSADPDEIDKSADNFIERKKVVVEGPQILGKLELSDIEKSPKKPFVKPDGDKRQRERKIITAKKIDVTKPSAPNSNEKNTNKGFSKDKRFERGGIKKGKQDAVEITKKEVQDKIKQTLAKMNTRDKQVGRDKQLKSKIRDRNAERVNRQLENEKIDVGLIEVTEFVSVSDLASLMDVSVTQVISTCMSVGVFASINQRLDAEIIELVAGEFGFKVKFITAEDQVDEEVELDNPEDLLPRSPIVAVMGHVDHGKTSLLDNIRKANVVGGESGGITQHIGAYEVNYNGKKITFLDTPGHEAFTAMRARGAKVTDIAVIIIAADDAVMPQTKEAIAHAQAANVPMVFAINKVDKDGANPDRIYEQLSTMNILVESWGGKFQNQEIAAKKGLNVEKLLEKIILEAELLDLKANPNKNAIGTVIEASLEKGRGFVTKILIQEGTMEVGDPMVAGACFGRVKAMLNERGERVAKAGPSTPVMVLGLDGAPQAGEKLRVYEDEAEAKEIAIKRSQLLREQGIRTQKHITLDEIGRRLALGNFKQLNIIVKGDVDGSVEALSDSLLKISTDEVQTNIVYKGVGQISESDVMLASASDAILIAFQVRPSAQARNLAEKEGVEIRNYSVIYDAINEIKQAMEGMLEPTQEEKIVCNIEVRDVFNISKIGNIAGCFVQDGKITRNTKVRIIRDGIVIHTGELGSLKRFKDDVKEVNKGFECGLNINKFNDIQVGDHIEGYEMVEVKRKLI